MVWHYTLKRFFMCLCFLPRRASEQLKISPKQPHYESCYGKLDAKYCVQIWKKIFVKIWVTSYFVEFFLQRALIFKTNYTATTKHSPRGKKNSKINTQMKSQLCFTIFPHLVRKKNVWDSCIFSLEILFSMLQNDK